MLSTFARALSPRSARRDRTLELRRLTMIAYEAEVNNAARTARANRDLAARGLL